MIGCKKRRGKTGKKPPPRRPSSSFAHNRAHFGRRRVRHWVGVSLMHALHWSARLRLPRVRIKKTSINASEMLHGVALGDHWRDALGSILVFAAALVGKEKLRRRKLRHQLPTTFAELLVVQIVNVCLPFWKRWARREEKLSLRRCCVASSVWWTIALVSSFCARALSCGLRSNHSLSTVILLRHRCSRHLDVV